MGKETYKQHDRSDGRDLMHQNGKKGLLTWQKWPTNMAKETYKQYDNARQGRRERPCASIDRVDCVLQEHSL